MPRWSPGLRAAITNHITPHVFRHTFATDLYRETGKIRLVQKELGHSDLSTTMIYSHVYDDEIESAMRQLRTGSRQLCSSSEIK